MKNDPFSHSVIRWAMLIAVYFLVASASFSGYFSKWHFRDGMPDASLPKMLDGTADRPYVYRRMLPDLANGIESATPASLKQRVVAMLLDDQTAHHPIARFYANTPDSRDPSYALRYYLVYTMSFGSLLLGMFALRSVCLELHGDLVGATLAPLAFAPLLPLLQSWGGYYYDMSEIPFLALAALFALRGRTLSLFVLTAFASWNKESFLFYAITLYPLLRTRFLVSVTLRIQAVLIAIAATVNLLMKLKYAHNSGGIVQIHLIDNLMYLANPIHFLRFEYNYGMPSPGGANIITLALLVVLVRAGWPRLTPLVRQWLLLGVAINLPLYFAFGFHDELRVFSMLYVGFVMILCVDITAYLERGRRVTGLAPPPHGTAGLAQGRTWSAPLVRVKVADPQEHGKA